MSCESMIGGHSSTICYDVCDEPPNIYIHIGTGAIFFLFNLTRGVG